MFASLTILATLLVSQLAAAQDGSSIASDLVKRQNTGPFIPGTSPGCPPHWPICGTSNTCYDPTQGDTCCPTGTYACPGGSYCLIDPYCCPNGLDPKVCAAHFNITLPAAYSSGSSTATGSSSSSTGSSSSSSSNSGNVSGSSSSSGGSSGSSGSSGGSGSSSGSSGNGSSSSSNGSGSSSGTSSSGSNGSGSSSGSGSGSSSGSSNGGSCNAGTGASGGSNNGSGSGSGSSSSSSMTSQVGGANATTTGPNIPLFTGAASKPALAGSLGVLLGSLSVLGLIL